MLNALNAIRTMPGTQALKKIVECLLVCFPTELEPGLYKTVFLQLTGKRSLTGTIGKQLSKLRPAKRQAVAEPTAFRGKRCEQAVLWILSGKPSAAREPSCPLAYEIANFGRKGVCSN